MLDPTEYETHKIATNVGDARFLRWIYRRMLHVYGEDSNMDYMRVLKKFGDKFHETFCPKDTA